MDYESRITARLRKVMEALDLNAYQRARVLERIGIWDISGENIRLAELDGDGNITLTPLADQIVAAYAGKNIAQIVFDPAVSFGPGERLVNDSEQSIVIACRRIIRGLGCAVRVIHHSGKGNARSLSTDQYTSRGGTALPDGARMVAVLTAPNETDRLVPPPEFKPAPGRSVFLLTRAKLSYAPPQSPIWIFREGYHFEFMSGKAGPSEADKARGDAEALFEFIKKELGVGRKHTGASLEVAAKLEIGLSKACVTRALGNLLRADRVCRTPLPEDECQGGRKEFINIPDVHRGGTPLNGSQDLPANLPKTTSPPIRKWGGGEVSHEGDEIEVDV